DRGGGRADCRDAAGPPGRRAPALGVGPSKTPPSSPDLSAGESGNTLQGFDRLGSELFVETARRESMTPVPCAEAGQVNISFTQLGVWRMVTLRSEERRVGEER